MQTVYFLKKELIKPTKIYVKEILNLIDKNLIQGCANITGGGLEDNIKRIIPNKLSAEIYLDQIRPLKIFKWLKNLGINDKEMLKTFNCGVGFCLIVNSKNLKKVIYPLLYAQKKMFAPKFYQYTPTFYEVPLLFEERLSRDFDYSIFVSTNPSKRKQIAEKVNIISSEDIITQRPSSGADLVGLSPGVRIQKSQGGGGSLHLPHLPADFGLGQLDARAQVARVRSVPPIMRRRRRSRRVVFEL